MKKFISLLIILVSVSFAKMSCQQLYNEMNEVLEPQMTQLCHDANNPDVMLFDFYIYNEQEGYVQMELAYLPLGSYLFVGNEKNPFKCGDERQHQFQNNNDILKMLFLTKDCDEDFRKSIGIN